MTDIINVYCDESCHLEHDNIPIMLLGAIWCSRDKVQEFTQQIKTLQEKHHAQGELKWTKVSSSKVRFYLDLVEWFFNQKDLYFRVVIIKDKQKLNHTKYNNDSHDIFYYKMYFSLLNKILDPVNMYNIYLDIKDTRSKFKLHKLEDILCNNVYDFTHEMIHHIQNVHSIDLTLVQLTDFFLGATAYKHRAIKTSEAKLKVVNKIEENLARYNLSGLSETSSLNQKKYNIFIFTPRQEI